MPTTSPITRWSRRHTLLAGAALLSGSARATDAAWPGGPVVIHTPYGAGGTSRTLPALRDAFAAAGRDPAELWVAPMAVEPTPAKLQHFATTGIHEVGLRLPTADADTVRRTLDRYAPLLALDLGP